MATKEVRAIKVKSTQIASNILPTLETGISSWKKMKEVIGYVLLFNNNMKKKQVSKVYTKIKVQRKSIGYIENWQDWKDDIKIDSVKCI